jgi:Uma2 family endonuclease
MSTITEPESVLTPEVASAMSGDILYELVDGRLVEKNMSAKSTFVAGNVAYLLKNHCRSPLTAYVFAEHSYTCFPSKPRQMRRPDVSLILATRMTAELFEEGVSTIRPDLVVEVVSPNDLVYDLLEKLDDYRDASVPLVWIVYPPNRRVEIIRADATRSELGPEGELTGEDILPGFHCRVADLFAGLPEIKPEPQA